MTTTEIFITQKKTSVTTHTSYAFIDKAKFHYPTNDALLKCNCMKVLFTLHKILLSTLKTMKMRTRCLVEFYIH